IDRDSEVYDMNHKRRGVAIIFNHIHFKKLATRKNADKDSSELASALRNLGFEVRVYIDPNLKTISSVLQTSNTELINPFIKASAEDHTDADCLVIAAMSHGESGFLFSADSVYSADSLWTPFTANRCPTLAGKPKLFFIQACRGTQTDSGVEIRQETDSATAYTIPSFADILVAYSTYDGFYSMRNSDTGSWFIQALCRELNKNGKTHDLLRIMTSVIRHVAIDYQSYAPHAPNIHKKKQVPSIVSMLTRLVYFSKDEMDDALKTARRSRLSLDF
ncbi:Caspase-1, partial [Habropoda laboriosa]